MDVRIVLCVVVAVVAVEARVPPRKQCAIFCPNGFAPGSRCVCNEGTKPGGLPCALKNCGITKRCVAHGNKAFCIPRRPGYPVVPRCLRYCRYGFAPGSGCQCNVGPGSRCGVKRCKLSERCVVRGIRRTCVPRRPSRVCYQPKKVGPCEALIPRFFYNIRTRRCEHFNFGGCEPNGNNFETIEECNRTCPSIPRRTGY